LGNFSCYFGKNISFLALGMGPNFGPLETLKKSLLPVMRYGVEKFKNLFPFSQKGQHFFIFRFTNPPLKFLNFQKKNKIGRK
jgi:hypothetical protein